MNIATDQLIGIAAGIFTSASMIPQLIKMIREKKAENISVIMLCILLAGIALWIAYGFIKQDIPIIATNCFSFLLNIFMIILRVKYAGKK